MKVFLLIWALGCVLSCIPCTPVLKLPSKEEALGVKCSEIAGANIAVPLRLVKSWDWLLMICLEKAERTGTWAESGSLDRLVP